MGRRKPTIFRPRLIETYREITIRAAYHPPGWVCCYASPEPRAKMLSFEGKSQWPTVQAAHCVIDRERAAEERGRRYLDHQIQSQAKPPAPRGPSPKARRAASKAHDKIIVGMLLREEGATIAEISVVTGLKTSTILSNMTRRIRADFGIQFRIRPGAERNGNVVYEARRGEMVDGRLRQSALNARKKAADALQLQRSKWNHQDGGREVRDETTR